MEYLTPNTILMTADTLGGVWTYAMDLCRVLQRQNINVHLATMGEPLSQSQNRAAAALPNVHIYESRYALEWMNDPWEDVDRAGKWLLGLEQDIQPDLVHLNNYCHGNLPWRAPVLVVGHSCVLSWWKAVKGEKAPPEWKTYHDLIRRGLWQADSIIAVSRYMRDCLEEFYGPLIETKVIYNGRDTDQFKSGAKEEIIFSMGRIWDDAKNMSSLRQIAGELSWPVYLAGEMGEMERPSSGNVNLLGRISQKEAKGWLAKTAIYVMPAKYEPFGLSVLEAAMSGCALVLGDIPSLKEIWEDAAVYADPWNPAELKEKICFLSENTSERKLMAQKARKRAKRYSMDRFEKNYLNLYRRMSLFHKKRDSSIYGTVTETET